MLVNSNNLFIDLHCFKLIYHSMMMEKKYQTKTQTQTHFIIKK